MPHVQARINDELFKRLKIKAIDNNISLNDLIKEALVNSLELSTEEKEALESYINELNPKQD